MERDSARGAKILARYVQTGLKNPCNRYHFFHPGLKKERDHTHRLCFRSSVNFLMEICVLRQGWYICWVACTKTQNNKTKRPKRGKASKRPERNHRNQRKLDYDETSKTRRPDVGTSEITKTFSYFACDFRFVTKLLVLEISAGLVVSFQWFRSADLRFTTCPFE